MLKRNMISKALHESAKNTAPPDETYQNILSSILPGAEMGSGPSYANAASKIKLMVRTALLSTIGIFASTGVALAAVVTAILLSPGIVNVYVENEAPMVQVAHIVIVVNETVPVRSVIVIPEEGVPLVASSDEGGTYKAPVNQNGDYTIEVTGLNGQTSMSSVQVDCVDSDIPEMTGYEMDNNYLYIHFYDELSGVDWDSVYAEDQTGQRIDIVEARPDQGLVVFAIPEASLDLYVQDMVGNAAKSIISVEYK